VKRDDDGARQANAGKASGGRLIGHACNFAPSGLLFGIGIMGARQARAPSHGGRVATSMAVRREMRMRSKAGRA
jgi:hypothetical protein